MLLSGFLLPTRWQAEISLDQGQLLSRAAENRKANATVTAIRLCLSLQCSGDILHPQCVPELKSMERFQCSNSMEHFMQLTDALLTRVIHYCYNLIAIINERGNDSCWCKILPTQEAVAGHFNSDLHGFSSSLWHRRKTGLVAHFYVLPSKNLALVRFPVKTDLYPSFANSVPL